jgi:hypothetical protein
LSIAPPQLIHGAGSPLAGGVPRAARPRRTHRGRRHRGGGGRRVSVSHGYVLAVRRSVRCVEIRPDVGVGVGVVRFCGWSRVVPVVCDRICWKAAPQTASWKTCRTCFPRCRNPRALYLRLARGA